MSVIPLPSAFITFMRPPRENASLLLSGDKTGRRSSLLKSGAVVICCRSVPSGLTVQIECGAQVLQGWLEKAIRSASGDHDGVVSSRARHAAPGSVTENLPVPAGLTVNTFALL